MKKVVTIVGVLVFFLFGYSAIFPSANVYADCPDPNNSAITYPENTQLCQWVDIWNPLTRNVLQCIGGTFTKVGKCERNFIPICNSAAVPAKGDVCAGTYTPDASVPVAKCPGDYLPGLKRCQNNKVELCKANGGSPAWELAAGEDCTALFQTCQEPAKGAASCTAGPTSTPVPTVTPTPGPTNTPIPDPAIQCEGYNSYTIRCSLPGQFGLASVERCENDGSFHELGLCVGCTRNGPPAGDTCANLTVVTPTPVDTDCTSDTSVGQLGPQPGGNCGFTQERALDEYPGTTPEDIAKREEITKCCYSYVRNFKVPNIGKCYIQLPGAEDLLGPLEAALQRFIDRAPFFTIDADDPNAPTNLKKLQEQLAEIPACANGGVRQGGEVNEASCRCDPAPPAGGISKFCDLIYDPTGSEQTACTACMTTRATYISNIFTGATAEKTVVGGGIWTGVGCINISNENGFVQSLLGLGISLGGGFSLLCLMYSAFTFQRSQGNPEMLKKAQEMITSCVTGLLLIIFAVFILQLIGYTILRIPGLG